MPDLTAPTFTSLGDCALRIHFGRAEHPRTRPRIRAFCAWLNAHPLPGVTDCVPAYETVTIYYDPLRLDPDTLRRHLTVGTNADNIPAPLLPVTEIPVRYGGAHGPDLASVAARHALTPAQVITLHAAPTYEVVMLGFLPGFPYLAGLPEILHTPRLASPRAAVPAGSVAIGGTQAGIYPCASPGGWNIIGRTRVSLFDINTDPPALLQPGARVRFVPDD